MEHGNRLPRGTMGSPSLEVFKRYLDMVLGNLIQVTCLSRGTWLRQPLEFPYNLNHSVIASYTEPTLSSGQQIKQSSVIFSKNKWSWMNQCPLRNGTQVQKLNLRWKLALEVAKAWVQDVSDKSLLHSGLQFMRKTFCWRVSEVFFLCISSYASAQSFCADSSANHS